MNPQFDSQILFYMVMLSKAGRHENLNFIGLHVHFYWFANFATILQSLTT